MSKNCIYPILVLYLFLFITCDKKDDSIINYSYPQIISTIPASNALAVPLNIIISINYDSCCSIEQLKPITLSINNLETTVSYTINSVYFKPIDILDYDKSYTITVSDALNGEYTFQFMTQANQLPDFPDLPGS